MTISSEAIMCPDRESAWGVVEFDAQVVIDDNRPVVVIRGEVDLATGPEFAAALDVAMTSCPSIDVDLSETTFIDSSGIVILLEAHKRLGQLRDAIVLRDPSPPVQRVFDLAGIRHLFTVRTTEPPTIS